MKTSGQKEDRQIAKIQTKVGIISMAREILELKNQQDSQYEPIVINQWKGLLIWKKILAKVKRE